MVEVDGTEVAFRHPRQSIRSGMAFVPADRKLHGLVLEMSVRENLVMASTSRLSRARRPAARRELRGRALLVRRDATSARTRRACRSRRCPAATSRRSCSGSGSRPSPGADARRADARRRRRREERDLPVAVRRGRERRRDPRLLVREPGAADALRPRHRHVSRAGRGGARRGTRRPRRESHTSREGISERRRRRSRTPSGSARSTTRPACGRRRAATRSSCSCSSGSSSTSR